MRALLAAALMAVFAATPAEEFDKAKTAFARSEYARVIEIVTPLLYPSNQLESEIAAVQAHRMLGVSYFFQKQPDEARREFAALLRLRPEFRFDALVDSPQVVEFFNGVAKEQAAELERLEAARKKAEDEAAAARVQRIVIERRFERKSFVVNFLPFGAGQFQNGQARKGWAFLGVEAALAATSLGAFAANFGLYGFTPKRRCLDPQASGRCPTDRIDQSDQKTSRLLLDVQLVGGGLFYAVAAWGIVDAIRNFRAEVPLGQEVERRLPMRSSAGPAVRPLVGPGGLGFEGTF